MATLVACSSRAPVPTAASSKQLETFDQAWKRIGESFPHENMNGVDWNALRDELRPKAAKARNAEELRPILTDMMGRLGESHFQVIPGSVTGAHAEPRAPVAVERSSTRAANDEPPAPESATRDIGDLGFEVRPLGDEFLVTRVEDGSPAALAGVRLGWALQDVNGVSLKRELADLRREIHDPKAADLHAWLAVTHELQGEPGTTAALTFLTGGNGRAELRVVRRVAPGETFQLGNLPPLITRFEH